MKRLLSLLLIIGIIFSMNSYAVLAQHTPDGVMFFEDFNNYEGTGLPSGWSWTNVNSATINEASPFVSGYGNDTALRLRTEGSNPAYFGTGIPAVSITDGVAKLSFQIYFDEIGDNISSTQLITIYAGTTDSPLMKGIRFINGVVYYYNYDPNKSGTSRFTYSETEAYVMEKKWYTFDIVNDYDNKKVTYYMNGKPIVDKATGEFVETPTFVLSSESVSAFQIAARTKHANYSEHGDIIIDNISVSKSLASGAYVPSGNELKTNPSSLDVRFNNSINAEKFMAEEVTVNTYAVDDIMLENPIPVEFSVDNISSVGCEVVFGSEVLLENYDRLVIDFGENTDFTGGKLSAVNLVKIPEAETVEPTVIYDSESTDSSDVEIVAESDVVEVSDFAYGTKTAKLYETTDGGKVNIRYKDGTTNLFKEGYTYNLSFKMKALDTHNSKDSSQYNIVGRNYTGNGYLAVRLAVFLKNLNENNPRIYDYTGSGSTKIGSFYEWNTNANAVDAEDLFNNQKWLDVDMTYYPDLQRFDVTFTNEDGRTVTKTNVNSYFANDSSLAKDTKTAHDGTLKTIQFRIPKKGKLVLDEVKITETEVSEVSAALKQVLLKDENGSIISKNGSCYAPGIKTAELYFDGDVDADEVEKIVFTGDNSPAYSTEYSQFDKVYKIIFDKLLTGDSAYSIVLPDTLNLASGISCFDFETSEGFTNVSAADIISNDAESKAVVYTKNTVSEAMAPATLVIVSFKDGAVLDMDAVAVSADSGSYARFATDAIARRIEKSVEGSSSIEYEYADVVKSFVLNNTDLTHVSDFIVEENSIPEATTFDYNYSGEADTEYVTAVLMTPTEADTKVSNSLDSLANDGAFSYIDVVKVENGEFSLGFDITGDSGKYTLYVMDETGVEVLKKEIYYSDPQQREDIQTLVNQAVSENETSAVLLTVLNDYAIELGLMDIDLYHDIDKQHVADELYASVKAVAVDVKNPVDTQKRVGDICIIDALNGSKTDDIGKYSSLAAVFEKEPIKTWYDKDIADTKKITARLLNKAITAETFSGKLMEALALEIIDEGNGYENVKLLCELLQKEIGINASAGTTAVYRALDGDNFASYAALKEAFNTAIETTQKPDSIPAGGGGGGGGGFTPSVGVTNSDATTYEEEKTVAPQPLKDYVFSDIAEYDWAVDSITELYEKNIISGRDEKTFAPGERVLREEFVKMIVEAFAVDGKSDVKFDDVSDSDWSKPYILRAYGAGIINGEGNTFGKGKSITRQDMAKIIYETAVKSGIKLETGDISALSDYGKIASYATDAVSALYKSGIINGKGENIFAPTDYATRAEAAVIISRAMALIK